MFLKLKISCTCNCNYYVNEQINTEKVICPNCAWLSVLMMAMFLVQIQ